MHRIYTTEALILDSRAYGEADRMVIAYTRDFGLLRVLAKGVRFEKSKLRYSLTPYALSELSLVKGKEIWRVTSAKHETSFTQNTETLRRTVTLIKKMSPEETPDHFLFDALKGYMLYLQGNEGVLLKEAETSIALTLLSRLGYIASDPKINDFLSEPFSREKLISFSHEISRAVGLINQALKHAHL